MSDSASEVSRVGRFAVAALVLAAAGFMWLLWQGPWFLDRAHLGTGTTPAVAAVVSGFRTAVVAIGAGVVAGAGLVISHRVLQQTRVNDQAQVDLTRDTLELAGRRDRETAELTGRRDREQAELIREGQVTDRFTKAITQLAGRTDVERLGGIYALERIMRDSEKDHATVVEVLAAFVRYHAPLPEETENQTAGGRRRISEPVQAALTVLGRRPQRHEPFNIDLHRTDLRNADFNEANLVSVQFWEADLRDANLFSADLREANLYRTDLSEANLRDADVTGARMQEAFLRGTHLQDTAGLTPQQVVAGYPSSTTRLPAALAADQDVQERIIDLEMPS